MFLRLKQLHVNSRVYNFSLLRVSKQAGMSRNGLRRYIQFFKDAGWVREEGKDLIFMGHNKLMKFYGFKKLKTRSGKYFQSDIKLADCTDHKKILSNLRYEIIRARQVKFNYVKQKKDDLIEPLGAGMLQRHKSAKKYFKGVSRATLSEVPKYYTISVASLANHWAVSSSTASRYIKKFEMGGAVKVFRKNLSVVYRKGANWDEEEIGKFCFYHKGFLFKQMPNQYIFS